jgi:hypothetical protein
VLKYLRIAVTALSLTACVLLVALWVRSYWRTDAITGPVGATRWFIIHTTPNQLNVLVSHPLARDRMRWKTHSHVNAGKLRWKFNSQQYAISLVIPIWFAALCSVVIAAAPWSGLSKRFSLRTLLIVTALVAVGLGIIALSS